MKEKRAGESETPTAKEDGGQSADYMIGQVSSSLLPKKSTPGSGSLAALFSTQSSANTLVFVPAPKPVKMTTTTKDKDGDGTASGKKQKNQKQKSAADMKLENRESGLQNADEEEVKKIPKKKKRKTTEGEEEGSTVEEERRTKRQKTVTHMAEERIKMKRTVFVGNLPVSCNKKALQIVFREQGAIESIRFRSVAREDPTMTRKVAAIQRKVHPKKQSINAYVVFKDEEGAVNALKRNGLEILKDFHIRVDKVSKNATHDHKRSIFVGNLPYDIMELPVRQHFEDCGNVEAVRLVRDRDTGMGKGFGYVLFESSDSVMLALKLDGSELLDRQIRVKRSMKEKEKKVARGSGPGGKAGKGREAKGTGPKKGFRGGPKQGHQNKSLGKPFQRNPGKAKTSTSFKGEMADPTAKKGKGLKKKLKPRKRNQTVHI